MFNRNSLKSIACIVLIAYITVFSASSVFAQTTTPEEEKALRQIYNEKIQRLEAEMNSARGTRNTLLTVSVTSFFVGAGIMASTGIIDGAITDYIPEDTPQQKDDKDKALEVVDSVNGVGIGALGVGGAGLIGYLIYSGIISGKQKKVDTLRVELGSRFAAEGLTPEYLQRNESVAVVVEEIENAKKKAGSYKTLQGLFSRLSIGSLVSGGFLFTLSTFGEKAVEDIEIDETDLDEVEGRDRALDEIENIETTGIILLGTGVASGVASFFFGRMAKGKEKKIDELENSLLRVAERIDFQPKINGFMVMYTHEF
jgi:MFS family permease